MAARKKQPRTTAKKQPDPVIHVHYVHHFHHVGAPMQPIMGPPMAPATAQSEFIMGAMAPGFYAGHPAPPTDESEEK